MSLQTGPIRKIFNTLSSSSIAVSGGIVTIQGLPPFAVADIVSGSCYRSCKTACVPQFITVTPTVPSATCECPWRWEIVIRKLPCLGTYRVQETLSPQTTYDYNDPNGATPTVAQIVASVVLQINSNPDSIVTATAVGAPGSETAFTLVEKDCDGDAGTCGFIAYIQSGTIATSGGSNVAHADPVLSPSEMAREFAILPGSMFSNPELAFCGAYCVFTARILPITDVHDPHLSNSLVDRYLDIQIFVNTLASNFDADWQNEANTVADCWAAEVS